MLEYIHFGDEDFLYIIGDAVDRGEEPIPLLRYIMEQPNMELLMGNHEQGFLWNMDVNTSSLSDTEVRRFWLEQRLISSIWNFLKTNKKKLWIISGNGQCIRFLEKIFLFMPGFLRKEFATILWKN